MKKVVFWLILTLMLLVTMPALAGTVYFELFFNDTTGVVLYDDPNAAISCCKNDLAVMFNEIGDEMTVTTKWNDEYCDWEIVVETDGKVIRGGTGQIGLQYYDMAEMEWKYTYDGVNGHIKLMAEMPPKSADAETKIFCVDRDGNILLMYTCFLGMYGEFNWKIGDDDPFFTSDDIVPIRVTNEGAKPNLVYVLVEKKQEFIANTSKYFLKNMPFSSGFMVSESIINRIEGTGLKMRPENDERIILEIPIEDLKGKGDVWVQMIDEEIIITPMSEKNKEE